VCEVFYHRPAAFVNQCMYLLSNITYSVVFFSFWPKHVVDKSGTCVLKVMLALTINTDTEYVKVITIRLKSVCDLYIAILTVTCTNHPVTLAHNGLLSTLH
jgi:hypothetical protein